MRPVVDDFALFATSYLLLLFPSFYNVLSHNCIPFAVLFVYFAVAYLLFFPTVFLRGAFKSGYKAILLIVLLIGFCANFVCVWAYGATLLSLNNDAISAILATNASEATEFLSIYVNANRLQVFAVSITFVLISYFLIRKLKPKFNNYIHCGLLLVLLASAYFMVKDYRNTTFDGLSFLLSYKPVPNLCDYKQNPSVAACDCAPENIVMILGESFSKSNSSLYCYEKETNPKLAKLVADGSLSVFTDITSYTINTIPSIKSIIRGWREELADSIEWYKSLTLLEVMQNAGYKTYWLSNQSKAGVYDNEVGRFADLCDGENFVGDKYSGLKRTTLDEALLPALDEQLAGASGRNFYILQLMGSHSDFKRRYPEQFSKFTADDYSVTHSRLTADNRQLLSEYDNSVLYNDSVVYEIMERFSDDEAVVFYFSDHAIDVFQSCDDYIGHASIPGGVRDNNIYGRLIPFMVYTTPKFKERFPQVEERIKRAVGVSYRTDSIMYTIMDVAGIETVNGISYKLKSLFK